jgi:hypothetical protein
MAEIQAPQVTENKVEFADEEVNLRDLLMKIQAYAKTVLKNWWIIGIIGAAMGAYSYYSTSKIPRVYKATANFMVSDKKEEASTNDYASLDIGLSERKAIKYNLDKIIQLSMSMKVVHRALFEKRMVRDTMDYLANHIIHQYHLRDKWVNEDPRFQNFSFTHDSIPGFTRMEKVALKGVYNMIVGATGEKRLSVSHYDEDSEIISITSETTNEALTLHLTVVLYEKLAEHYIKVESERQEEIYRLTKEANDSMKQELLLAQNRLLRFEDTHMGLARKEYETSKILLENEVQKRVLAFGKTFSNLQDVAMALRNTIPFIHEIDRPIEPLRSFKPSPISSAINGVIIGCILGAAFFISRKILKDIFSEFETEFLGEGEENQAQA